MTARPRRTCPRCRQVHRGSHGLCVRCWRELGTLTPEGRTRDRETGRLVDDRRGDRPPVGVPVAELVGLGRCGRCGLRLVTLGGLFVKAGVVGLAKCPSADCGLVWDVVGSGPVSVAPGSERGWPALSTVERFGAADVVGMAEIGAMLGVAAQTVRAWRTRGVLPAASAELAMGPVWARTQIEAWARETGRLPEISPAQRS